MLLSTNVHGGTMQMNYKRLAQGLANQHSTLIPVNENIFNIIKNNPSKDYYVSLYQYADRHLEHFNKTKSVAGIKDVTTPKILFDFDDSQNIEAARKDAIEVCARLIKHGVDEDYIRIYFSGNKGFGVEVLTNQEMTRQEFSNIVFALAGDLKTFDTRINDEPRVIRAPLSQHPKSKLHKIPLDISELVSMSIDDIKMYALDISGYKAEDFDDELFVIPMPEKLNVLKTKEYKKISAAPINVDLKFDIKDIDFSKCPKWLPKERYALQEGFFFGSDSTDKGERNSAFMIMAATYKNQGFSPDHTLGLLYTMAEKQAKRTGESPYTEEQLRREIINTVFNGSWKGGIYGKDEELLNITRARFNIIEKVDTHPNLVKITDVAVRFKEFAKTFEQNRIMTGIKSIDDNVILTTGMMCGLLGSPGCGKTTLSNTFIEYLSKNDTPVIYESLDMYDNLLYTRLLQKYVGYDMKKILDMYKDDVPDLKLQNAYTEVIKNYSNVEFNFRSGPTVEEIEQDVINYKENSGKQPKLLVVDYLEKVRGPFSDATANSAYVASRLSDIAKRHDICVLVLLQPQKSAGGPEEELLSMRKIKGASVIEQDCRVVMTMWRPGYNPTDSSYDNYMSIAIVKNNMGGLNKIDLGWHGLTGTFRELDSTDRAELRLLRKRIEDEKAKSNEFNI